MWLDENPYEGTGTAGPQMDGTYVSPVLSPAPADAGGGAPANYSQAVLDVFKFGVGVWQQREQQQAMLDYKRYEATQTGVTQQGLPAAVRPVQVGGMSISPMVLVIGAGLLAVALLARRR